ncbi:MAG: FeoB-associated Cys-rich membrane protein [Oscillospiraceae bacterium]|nr:FeoB-associated Cys-rich membrane protein [Oscillospiraceae bacterium]
MVILLGFISENIGTLAVGAVVALIVVSALVRALGKPRGAGCGCGCDGCEGSRRSGGK